MAGTVEHPLTIRLFGAFQVVCEGRPLPALRSQKGKWLLAILTLRHGREVQRPWLADLLWPDQDKAQHSLNTSVFDLRKALGAEAARLPHSPRTLRLDLDGADVDVIRFDAAIADGDMESLQRAVALYTAPLLEDCTEPWVVQEREARANAYAAALEKLAARALADGDRAYGIECLQKALAVDLPHERTHRWLMEVLADGGDFAGALQVYHDLTRQLQREGSYQPEPATTALYHHIRQRGRQRASPPAKSAVSDHSAVGTPVIAVPRPLTALLGREQELQTIIHTIPTARLITLTGPGGVGKTRLATEAAIEAAANLAYGVHLITLEALQDPALIPQQLAKALRLDLQAGLTWTETLVAYLRERPLLLVIDNCEHLIEACADLVRKLLSTCPGLHLLATSRERLGLTGEVVRQIAPLALPTAAHTDLDQCAAYPAIKLFCERAAAVHQDFQLTASNVAEVVAICRRLDGLPLALELAAALADTLSLRDIEANLAHRFQLLQAGDRTASPRHQALKAALDWSYSRLPPPEQALLRRLSVFSGGWTLAAAEAVVGASAGKDRDSRALMSRLVSKSLVIASQGQAETRYTMLETIREYGRELLAQEADATQARQAHCEYYISLAETAAPNLLGPSQAAWLDSLEAEHSNLRAALLRATQEAVDARLALRLGSALWRFWYIRGYYDEGQTWLAAILRLPCTNLKPLRLVALRGLGNLYYARDETGAARPCFEECLALARELGDDRSLAAALASLANLETGEHNYEQARRLYIEAMQRFEALDDTRGRALTCSNLARLCCLSERDYTQARRLHLQGLALYREMGSLHEIAYEGNNLAHTLLQLGETADARGYLRESLNISERLESGPLLAHCLTNWRSLAILEGKMERAAVLMSAEMALRRRISFPLPGSALADHQLAEQAIRRSLGDTLFAICQAQGNAMTEAELRAFALEADDEAMERA